MKLPFILTGLVGLLLLAGSCNDSRGAHPICEALNIEDVHTVERWIDAYADPLRPRPSVDDPIGHEANLVELVRLLDELDCLSAEVICYACIETYPPISEIRISTDENYKVVDLRTSEKGPMTFSGWHE